MMREDRIRLRNKDAPIPPAGENGSGPVARRGPAAQAGQSRWNLVEPAGSKLFFDFRLAKIN